MVEKSESSGGDNFLSLPGLFDFIAADDMRYLDTTARILQAGLAPDVLDQLKAQRPNILGLAGLMENPAELDGPLC